MKRQDGLTSSSSSRRENSPENLHAKSIGCMSGIFHLVCKYQNRRRFLTFGKKQEKNAVSSPTNSQKSSTIQRRSSSSLQQQEHTKESNKNAINDNKHIRRLSYDVQRSPTLPAEIRRSNSLNSSENFRTPPALVAKLMGLPEIPATSTAESAVTEKRLKLLGALEKCDEDLKALKKIIEVVKSVGVGHDHKDNGIGNGREEGLMIEKGWDLKSSSMELQPSPVSVLDELTRSALIGYSKRYTNGRVLQQQKQLQKRKSEEIFFDRITTESDQTKSENAESSPLWTSKAMVDSVNEVCKDIAWGERREIGRIGLALQDHICRDLIEEIVRELGSCRLYSLPFEACKRRLRF